MTLELSTLKFNKGTSVLELEFSIISEDFTNLEYAYYVLKGDKDIRIKTEWYVPVIDNKTIISYVPEESGEFRIRVFIKDQNNKKTAKSSNPLFIDINNNGVVESTFKNEKIFYLDDPVKYLFQPSEKKSPYLLVIFSGLHTREYKGGTPVYNYIKTLQDTNNYNKLFILDEYRGQFCYYLGHNCQHGYEKAVIALITTIANQLNISSKNIIACGSSKGGTAALYYGIKYHFGSVISGAPQTYIANFLEKLARRNLVIQKALYNMTGINVEKGKRYINNLLFRLIDETESFPNLKLHIGKGDYHYEEHLIPLLDKLKTTGVDYYLDIQDYDDHSHTGTYYPSFLLEQLSELIDV